MQPQIFAPPNATFIARQLHKAKNTITWKDDPIKITYEEKEFVVDDLTYVIEYSNYKFTLFVDATKARTKIYEDLDQKDPFYGFSRDDVPCMEIMTSSDLVKTKSPLKVYKEVMTFVHNMIGKHKPHMFGYSSNEKRKNSLYSRVAKMLAEKHGYYLHEDDGVYAFYRLEG